MRLWQNGAASTDPDGSLSSGAVGTDSLPAGAALPASWLAALIALHLRNASGGDFDPGNHDAFRSWLLGANSVNMAYLRSAQLAAMKLSMMAGFVNGSALIDAPGTTSRNAAGFATVNAVMNEADTELGLHGYTPSGSDSRAYQGALKNALDKANNTMNFVQPGPCYFAPYCP